MNLVFRNVTLFVVVECNLRIHELLLCIEIKIRQLSKVNANNVNVNIVVFKTIFF